MIYTAFWENTAHANITVSACAHTNVITISYGLELLTALYIAIYVVTVLCTFNSY